MENDLPMKPSKDVLSLIKVCLKQVNVLKLNVLKNLIKRQINASIKLTVKFFTFKVTLDIACRET